MTAALHYELESMQRFVLDIGCQAEMEATVAFFKFKLPDEVLVFKETADARSPGRLLEVWTPHRSEGKVTPAFLQWSKAAYAESTPAEGCDDRP